MTASVDGSTRIWDANTGAQLEDLEVLDTVNTTQVLQAAFSRDGNQVASNCDRHNAARTDRRPSPRSVDGAGGADCSGRRDRIATSGAQVRGRGPFREPIVRVRCGSRTPFATWFADIGTADVIVRRRARATTLRVVTGSRIVSLHESAVAPDVPLPRYTVVTNVWNACRERNRVSGTHRIRRRRFWHERRSIPKCGRISPTLCL